MTTQNDPVEGLKNMLNSISDERCKAALEQVELDGMEASLYSGDVVCVLGMIAGAGDLKDKAMMFAASKARNPNLKALIDPSKGF